MSDYEPHYSNDEDEIMGLTDEFGHVLSDEEQWERKYYQLLAANKKLTAERDAARATANDLALDIARLQTDIAMVEQERDALAAKVERLRVLLGLLAYSIDRDHAENESKYCLCCGELMEIIQDDRARLCTNPDCPTVQARAYLDGKPVPDWRILAGELVLDLESAAHLLEVYNIGEIDEMACIDEQIKAYRDHVTRCREAGLPPEVES